MPRRMVLLLITAVVVALLVTSDASGELATCRGREASIVGTPGDDVLEGTPGRDVIAGGEGDDRIDGLGGRDIICGDRGSDALFGRGGRDVLDGGDGADLLNGGGRDDLLIGGLGADVLRGGRDDDRLKGNPGDDRLFGSSGNDVLNGGRGEDQADGGTGADTCRAEAEQNCGTANGAIVVDHMSTAIDQIPQTWLDEASRTVIWAYGSTSHGTQLRSGARDLDVTAGLDFSEAWHTVPAGSDLRMAYDSGWSWDPSTYLGMARELLADAPTATAFMWSWCGELSWDDRAVDQYLDMMETLEGEYPAVTFVYMTGHTDGGSATLERNNDQIRQYVEDHGKVLFDFADIESYDPSGTFYSNANDSCDWCGGWCAGNPADCGTYSGDDCAHSHTFNCRLKGRAFWWLSARLAGWAG